MSERGETCLLVHSEWLIFFTFRSRRRRQRSRERVKNRRGAESLAAAADAALEAAAEPAAVPAAEPAALLRLVVEKAAAVPQHRSVGTNFSLH